MKRYTKIIILDTNSKVIKTYKDCNLTIDITKKSYLISDENKTTVLYYQNNHEFIVDVTKNEIYIYNTIPKGVKQCKG